MINLVDAIKTGKLSEFIAEQESNGVERVSKTQFDAIVKKAVKAPLQRGRTSSSPVRGGSSGKKTR